MILTDIELRVMKAGNPPAADSESITRRNYEKARLESLEPLTKEEQSTLRREYSARECDHRTLCINLGINVHAGRKYLKDQGLLRPKFRITAEHLSTLRTHLRAGYTHQQISERTGWSTHRIGRMVAKIRNGHDLA